MSSHFFFFHVSRNGTTAGPSFCKSVQSSGCNDVIKNGSFPESHDAAPSDCTHVSVLRNEGLAIRKPGQEQVKTSAIRS